jgi:two-component system, chemotaxis family, chemotaxis protein CheY
MTTAADVLVVDDEEGLRHSVVDILRGAGYTVMEAEDGQAALDVLETKEFGVVILDQRMPIKTGVEVLDSLSSVPAVIFMSAIRIDATDRERIGDKVFSYLTKPVAPRFLLEEVAAAYRAGDRR